MDNDIRPSQNQSPKPNLKRSSSFLPLQDISNTNFRSRSNPRSKRLMDKSQTQTDPRHYITKSPHELRSDVLEDKKVQNSTFEGLLDKVNVNKGRNLYKYQNPKVETTKQDVFVTTKKTDYIPAYSKNIPGGHTAAERSLKITNSVGMYEDFIPLKAVSNTNFRSISTGRFKRLVCRRRIQTGGRHHTTKFAHDLRKNILEDEKVQNSTFEGLLGKVNVNKGRNLYKYQNLKGETTKRDIFVTTKKTDYEGGHTGGHTYNAIIETLKHGNTTDSEIAYAVLNEDKSKLSLNQTAAASKLFGIINLGEEARMPAMGKLGRGLLRAVQSGKFSLDEAFKTTQDKPPVYIPAYSKNIAGGHTAAKKARIMTKSVMMYEEELPEQQAIAAQYMSPSTSEASQESSESESDASLLEINFSSYTHLEDHV